MNFDVFREYTFKVITAFPRANGLMDTSITGLQLVEFTYNMLFLLGFFFCIFFSKKITQASYV